MKEDRVKSSTRRWFDRLARFYERSGPVSGWLARVQQIALLALELQSTDRLLDVGCGTGRAVREAAGVVERTVGIDLSPGMLEQARMLAGEQAGVAFYLADAENLPFDDGEFTALLCSTSFHHYPNPRHAAAEFVRVLAPGGRIVVADGCADAWHARLADRIMRLFGPGHVRLYRSAELVLLFREAGLVRPVKRTLLRGAYIVLLLVKPSPETDTSDHAKSSDAAEGPLREP